MKKYLFPLLTIMAALLVSCSRDRSNSADGYPYGQVPFTEVKVDDPFWSPRLKTSREVTVPLAFSKCEENGRYRNFEEVVHPDSTRVIIGYSFDDTDVYKTIEGASYILQTYPDSKLESYIDSVLAIVAVAQESDGYLNTARSRNPWHPHRWEGAQRWSKVEELSHELYNLGHLIEGAVAHYQATGKRNFLDIAIRYADCVCREVGDGEGQVARVPGHQIAEMALCKLSLVTGDKKYLNQAVYFLDKRGRTEHRDKYNQSHLPVVEQDEAVGHAVRAEYMYSGMADVAALTGRQDFIDAIDKIWENIVTRKLYITGGVGARYSGESFGDNWELPNLSAYCETCAAIGNVYTNYRLFLLHGESKYIDVLERSLYNGVLSGVSMDGGNFFYPNPLESDGSHQRQPWFGCACCPSNICRFIPSVPGYVYAARGKDLYVNLYMSNVVTHSLGGRAVSLEQETSYPTSGDVALRILENKAGRFALKLRIPGWARGEVTPGGLYSFVDNAPACYSVSVNGELVEVPLENGYFSIDRKWKAGDRVELKLEMQPRFVMADEAVEADRGRLAIEKGPLVFCAEWPDNQGDVLEAEVSSSDVLTLSSTAAEGLDGGIELICDGDLNFIPYYAWCHRGPGHMAVWIKEK